MKVSISKFYQEVTGSKTANKAITVAALTRWAVPISNGEKRGDNVDIVHLDNAKTMYAQEQAALDERRAERNGGHGSADSAALVQALRDVEGAIMLLVEHLGVLDTPRRGAK